MSSESSVSSSSKSTDSKIVNPSPKKKVPKQLLQSFKNTAQLPTHSKPIPPISPITQRSSPRSRPPLPPPQQQQKIVQLLRRQGMIPPPIFLPRQQALKAIQDLRKLGIPYPEPSQWQQMFGITKQVKVTDDISEESIALSNRNSEETDRSLINSLISREDKLEYYERGEEMSPPKRITSKPTSFRESPERVRETLEIPEAPEHQELTEKSSKVGDPNSEEERKEQERGLSKEQERDLSKEYQGLPELKLRRNYDRPSVYSSKDDRLTYYYPRQPTKPPQPRFQLPSPQFPFLHQPLKPSPHSSIQISQAESAIASSRQWLRKRIY